MLLVKTDKDINKNIETVEFNLEESEDSTDRIEMLRLIKRGHVFVCYKIDDEFHFVPSRFVGYKDNSIIKHKRNESKDGRITNKALEKIIGKKSYTEKIEKQFLGFCKILGISPDKNKRSYWLFNFNDPTFISHENHLEGKVYLAKHKARERNAKVVAEAKQLFKQKHGHLYCEECGIDMGKVYGDVGKDYIEAHHAIPLSEYNEEHEVKPEDFIMLCPNCHTMIHRLIRQGINPSKLSIRKGE